MRQSTLFTATQFTMTLFILTLFIRWKTTHPEKIEVLILKVGENGMLRDKEGRTRNSAGQLINAQGDVIPDVIDVAEMNDFDLSREW